MPSPDILSQTQHEGLCICDKWHSAGGRLGVLAWGGVCGGLGGSGMSGDMGIGRAGRAAVNSPLALGKCILSPSS